MRTYHIRKITNGKLGDYLVLTPSEENRLGIWAADNGHAIELGKTEAKGDCREIYRINNIRTHLEKVDT